MTKINSDVSSKQSDVQQIATKQQSSSFGRDIVIGSLSGATAVAFIQPMIFFKVKAQSTVSTPNEPAKSSRTFVGINPAWWRGGLGFAASFAPTIALQMAAYGQLAKHFDSDTAAAMAGAGSAAVVCPAEKVMIYQQANNVGFSQAFRQIVTTQGGAALFRAAGPTGVREGGFVTAYSALNPKMREYLKSKSWPEWAAQIFSGMVVGTAASVATHPFDTVKTRWQSNPQDTSRIWTALAQPGAFKGLGWRTAMMTTAVTVMPIVKEQLGKLI